MKTIMCKIAICVLLFGIFQPVRGQDTQTNSANRTSPENASEASPEEKLIRSTYEKLVLYNRAGALDKVMGDATALRPDSVLQFELKNFHTGPIEEIKGKLESEAATLPTGEVIESGRSRHSLNNGPEEATYSAWWGDGVNIPEGRPQWTIGELFGILANEYFDVGKYTSYEVTVSFQGKRRTYWALVLFHNLHQSANNPRPQFWDNIGAGGVLNQVWQEELPPLKSRKPAPEN